MGPEARAAWLAKVASDSRLDTLAVGIADAIMEQVEPGKTGSFIQKSDLMERADCRIKSLEARLKKLRAFGYLRTHQVHGESNFYEIVA